MMKSTSLAVFVSLIITLTILGTVRSQPKEKVEDGFYNIAHMTNTKNSVNWALGKGANSVEIDLKFSSSGNPEKFVHSPNKEACDCTCMCSGVRACNAWYPNSVCAQLENDVPKGHSACAASTDAATLLNHLASKSQLALVIIDSKIDGTKIKKKVQRNAGTKVVKLLEKELFAKGFRGKVIIGAPKTNAFSYLEKAASQASKIQFSNQTFFTLDGEKNSVEKVLNELVKLRSTRNRVFGTGISACGFGVTDTTYRLAAINKAKGVVGLSYLWTIDKKSSMEKAIRYFGGIMTNYPGTLSTVARETGIKLATPDSPIPPATSNDVQSSDKSFDCDCDYHRGGCSISKRAQKGLACYCKYKGFWTCGGSVVACRDPNFRYCKNPDKSISSCIQGFGDCGGYQSSQGACDCNYHRGGCTISRVPPQNTACRCVYKGAWTCGGMVTRCRDPGSIYCKNPDKSIQSCVQGGGDCEGYSIKDRNCDCDYHPGGCSISHAAPGDHACKCIYRGAWTCGGQVTRCRDPNSGSCKNPDKSIHSCFQGGGDCLGYKTAKCDCDYRRGGCVISKVPPRNTACKCRYRGFWTCSGSVTRCGNFNSRYCKKPDKTRATCHEGGGDCGGYRG